MTPSTPAAPVVIQHQSRRSPQHVFPIDPVIQGVEPELRVLLGLLTQLPSQLRDFRRQHDSGLHLRWNGRLVRLRGLVAFFRSGTAVQADLLASDGDTNLAGDLRSTGITPLRRYYVPLRLPTGPMGRYGFPSHVDPESHPDSGSPSRASQVPALIFRRPPSRITPEDPTVASARCFTTDIRLHHFRKASHPHWCNEAERVRLRYG